MPESPRNVPESLPKISIPKDIVENLPLHPKVLTIYKKELTTLSQKWENTFKTETAMMVRDSRSY